MSDAISKKALLDWIESELSRLAVDINDRFVNGYCIGLDTLLRRIDSGRFDIPSPAEELNYTEQDMHTAFTRELTDDRVATASAYWLEASPHERWVPDGIILARYARYALNEIAELREKRQGDKDFQEMTEASVQHLNGLVTELRAAEGRYREALERIHRYAENDKNAKHPDLFWSELVSNICEKALSPIGEQKEDTEQ